MEQEKEQPSRIEKQNDSNKMFLEEGDESLFFEAKPARHKSDRMVPDEPFLGELSNIF